MFTHTKRDIVVEGCTSGGFLSTKRGCFFSPREKRFLDAQKDSAVRATTKKTPLGIEPTTYGYNFRPIVNFRGEAGRLNRRTGQ